MFARFHNYIALAWLTAAQCLPAQASDFQGATHLIPLDEDTIGYTKAQPDSAISRLQKKLETGDASLPWDDKYGYLPALLKELDIPDSSQMLVFSKTSLQRERISPDNPRALFFNDDVYIGWIPGAPLIEVSVADPKMGGVFYTIEQKKLDKPAFKRTDQCLECHASTKSMGVPGHLVRSFQTDEDGVIDLASGTSQVNHRTPFEERWGGWYVTGTHGDQTHRGNLIGKAAFQKQAKEPNHSGNIEDLAKFINTGKYKSPGSDIVALMVFEHQTHMHNYIARLNYEAMIMQKTYGHVNYLRSIVDGFVRYLLFADEAPLTAKVSGSSSFQRDFEKLAVRDSKGRSLRDFDLAVRMFKYPCSYLIYSEAFNALPSAVKEKVYAKMFNVLTSKDSSEAYNSLSNEDRRAILEILAETKSDLPSAWKTAASQRSSS
ncbi:MAG TPA: hypothetical protein VF773_04790 [Verrucomicrobiae bacterium]